MIKIKQAVIVEGKYDKIKLSSILDALIIETEGFGIFKDKEKMKLIRKLADTRGILVLTDSDAAGFKIRSFIGGSIPKDEVIHAYIPDILGKERRKEAPSKEGKLGVEGVPKEIIIESLSHAGVLYEETENKPKQITKTDLYEDGLIGKENSLQKRRELLRYLELPGRLSANSLVQVLNIMLTYDEYKELIGKRFEKA